MLLSIAVVAVSTNDNHALTQYKAVAKAVPYLLYFRNTHHDENSFWY
jgi:hypothetical protein